jgi:hypothetical protein
MNIDNWNYYYKLSPEGQKWTSNLLYTPRMNQDGSTMVMSWNHTEEYQVTEYPRPYYTQELVDFFFEREIKYLNLFQHRSWSPKLLDIDYDKKLVFLEWNQETCNNILYSGRNLEDHCPDWKTQMFEILDDLLSSGHYKMSLYPHCYFIDKKGILKTFDFYATVEKTNPYIDLKRIEGMIGRDSIQRFENAREGDSINFEIFFKDTIENYIKWPDDALNEYYRTRFKNVL